MSRIRGRYKIIEKEWTATIIPNMALRKTMPWLEWQNSCFLWNKPKFPNIWKIRPPGTILWTTKENSDQPQRPQIGWFYSESLTSRAHCLPRRKEDSHCKLLPENLNMNDSAKSVTLFLAEFMLFGTGVEDPRGAGWWQSGVTLSGNRPSL